MLTISAVTKDYDKFCAACNARNKQNATSLEFYRVYFSVSKNSNGILLTFCNECLQELARKINVNVTGQSD